MLQCSTILYQGPAKIQPEKIGIFPNLFLHMLGSIRNIGMNFGSNVDWLCTNTCMLEYRWIYKIGLLFFSSADLHGHTLYLELHFESKFVSTLYNCPCVICKSLVQYKLLCWPHTWPLLRSYFRGHWYGPHHSPQYDEQNNGVQLNRTNDKITHNYTYACLNIKS